MNNVIIQSFLDELEKIAGLPRAVRSGGGGPMGTLMRRTRNVGKDYAQSGAPNWGSKQGKDKMMRQGAEAKKDTTDPARYAKKLKEMKSFGAI